MSDAQRLQEELDEARARVEACERREYTAALTHQDLEAARLAAELRAGEAEAEATRLAAESDALAAELQSIRATTAAGAAAVERFERELGELRGVIAMREAELAQALAIADDLRAELQRAESGAARTGAGHRVRRRRAGRRARAPPRRLDERDFDLTARERDVAERERRLARLSLDVRKRSLDMTNKELVLEARVAENAALLT